MNPFNCYLGSVYQNQPLAESSDHQLKQDDFFVTQQRVESNPEAFSEFLWKTFQLRHEIGM